LLLFKLVSEIFFAKLFLKLFCSLYLAEPYVENAAAAVAIVASQELIKIFKS